MKILKSVHNRGTMAEIGKKYNENDLQEAVKGVNEGRMSLTEIEQSFHATKSTINGRAKVN